MFDRVSRQPAAEWTQGTVGLSWAGGGSVPQEGTIRTSGALWGSSKGQRSAWYVETLSSRLSKYGRPLREAKPATGVIALRHNTSPVWGLFRSQRSTTA